MTIKTSAELLTALQTKSGLTIAAPSDTTGYSKAWIRDNVYVSLGLEKVDPQRAVKAMHCLFNIFLKHEAKIDHAIKEKPSSAYQYIHARYHPNTLEEFWEPWGNKQHDMVGAFLWRVADLDSKNLPVIRNNDDLRILKKLVAYLENVEYWHDADNGIWEEYEEVHASSVGACVAGLRAIAKIVPVPHRIIEKGQEVLAKLLPKESDTKDVDLALLSLIYPYKLTDEKTTKQILTNVKAKLERNKGIIRYENDQYYNIDGEAEWTMGFPWLAIIYRQLGNKERYLKYMKKTLDCINETGELPELYFANSNKHNDNSPLGWSQALYAVAAL